MTKLWPAPALLLFLLVATTALVPACGDSTPAASPAGGTSGQGGVSSQGGAGGTASPGGMAGMAGQGGATGAGATGGTTAVGDAGAGGSGGGVADVGAPAVNVPPSAPFASKLGQLAVVGARFETKLTNGITSKPGTHMLVVSIKILDGSTEDLKVSQILAVTDELQKTGIHLVADSGTVYPFIVTVANRSGDGPVFQIPSPVPMPLGKAFKLVWPPNMPIDLAPFL
jgi:hypothetical protein